MGRDYYHRIRGRHLEAVEVVWVTGRSIAQTIGRRGHCLRLIKSVKRSAAAIAEQDDVLKAALPDKFKRRRNVGQQHLVDARDVVAWPSPLLSEGRVPRLEQKGNCIMPAHVGPRMHRADDALLAAAGVEDAFR